MSDDRTEKPTPKKLREAREKGEVARSRELAGAVSIFAGLGAVVATGPGVAATLQAYLRHSLARAVTEGVTPGAAVSEGLTMLARGALPVAAAALLAGTLAAVAQVGFNFSTDAIAPKLERVDPFAGLKKLFAPANLAQLGLMLVKTAVACALAWKALEQAAPALAQSARLDAATAGLVVRSVLGPLALRLGGVLIAFGALDYVLARRRHLKSLRMSKDEVRREHKEQEGDPHHKAARKRAHRQILNARPIAKAACVVVNPTHIAVALFHDARGEDAPVVIAKGAGDEAASIRAEARRCGVPIVRDIPLARALYRLAEVGDDVPEELYEAAAGVLAHVYATKEVA